MKKKEREKKGGGQSKTNMFEIIIRLFLCLRSGQVVFLGELIRLQEFNAYSMSSRMRPLLIEELFGLRDDIYNYILLLGDCNC